MRSVTKLALGAAIICGMTAFTSENANANTILVFGQNGVSSEFSAIDNGNGTTSLSVTNGSISISGIDPTSGLTTPVTAILNLAASSTDAATISNDNLIQTFNGRFSIVQGTTNILSGTFKDLLTGSGSGAVLAASTPPLDAVTFTSDVIPLADLHVERALSLSFSNVVPATGLGVPVDGTYPSFTASISGNLSANDLPSPPPPALPEPMSMALLGMGLLGLGVLRRSSK